MTVASITAEQLDDQRAWSMRTFGPGPRLDGVLDHIRKELDEIEEHPDDVFEWADLLLLAFDGAFRAGHSNETVIDAFHAKHAINEAREWPDWRTVDTGRAIEHVRN